MTSVIRGGAAEAANIRQNDLITFVAGRRLFKPRDAVAALALLPEDATQVEIMVERGGEQIAVTLPLNNKPHQRTATDILGDCPHPEPVCKIRQAVFPISSFDPVGSATRIGPNLLVTSRHVVADRPDAVVHTPDGPRGGRVVASAYRGDLAIIEVEGLPETGIVASLEGYNGQLELTYAIGADLARQEVRVFDPGDLIAAPASDSDLGRIHVTSYMQPGVSGGALVTGDGTLIGINAGGGEGRYEAIPAADIRAALALREDPSATEVSARLGTALAECAEAINLLDVSAAPETQMNSLADTCTASENHGQLLEAGRLLARAGAFDAAIELHGQAVEQVPNSLNARLSLLVSLQLAARFEEMTSHARYVMELAPDDPQVLRFAIQSGVWGNAPELAEEAYTALLAADPMQAQAARRFIDSAPPAPARR